jgi:hypothetical protein
MLLSDVLGRAEHSDYIAVLDEKKRSIIIRDPYKKTEKHTIIIPINSTTLNRLKQKPELPYEILLNETKIKQLELILVNPKNQQPSQPLAKNSVQLSAIEVIIAKNRKKLAKEIIELDPAPTTPTTDTPLIEPVREYVQPQIRIQFVRTINLQFIRIEQTPLSLPVFASLILDTKKHLDTQEDINETKYQITNNKIVFADQTIKNINSAELKSFLKFYQSHQEKFEKEITSPTTQGEINDLIEDLS